MADGTVKCIEVVMPFEVPENWAWCRLISYSINRDGERKPVSSAIRKDFKRIYDYYGASGVIDKVEKYLFSERLLLVGEDGANLLTRSKPIAFLADGLYWVNNHAHVIDVTDKRLLEFLCFYINSINLEQYVTGSAQPKMTQANMNLILVPIPPIEEQVRINAAIHRAFKQISTIESDKSDLQSIITQAKSKILDLAIRGQLVPQDPSDEPASVLLERIRAEKEQLIKEGKIKRDKNESFIFRGDDKSYYERIGTKTTNIDGFLAFSIPENWGWCKLSSTCTLISGRDLAPTEYNDISKGIPYITGASNFDNHQLIINRWTPSPKVISSAGDLLITCKGTIGELLINENGDVHIARQIMALRNDEGLFMKFFKYTVMFFIAVIQESAHGVIPGISREDLLNIYLPIPPLSEQHRIAAAVDAAFAQLDTITDALA